MITKAEINELSTGEQNLLLLRALLAEDGLGASFAAVLKKETCKDLYNCLMEDSGHFMEDLEAAEDVEEAMALMNELRGLGGEDVSADPEPEASSDVESNSAAE